MTITINEAQIQNRLRIDRGLSIDLMDVGREVAKRARQNASGAIVGIRSGDLIEGIFVRPGMDARSEFVEVGSSAEHDGFAYPGFLDDTGRPWLTQALVDTVGVSHVRRT